MEEKEEAKISVFFDLKGEQAEQFLKYKKNQFLSSTAEAARKLLLERLAQVEQQAEPALAGVSS